MVMYKLSIGGALQAFHLLHLGLSQERNCAAKKLQRKDKRKSRPPPKPYSSSAEAMKGRAWRGSS